LKITLNRFPAGRGADHGCSFRRPLCPLAVAAPLCVVQAVLFIAAALSGCSDGRKSATLGRKTALLLLNETPQLFKGQGKKCDLKTREAIMPAMGWDQKRGELTIAFLDVLSGVGILGQRKETAVASGHDALGVNFPAYTLYAYSIVPQENVDTMYANSSNEIVLVTLAKPAVKEVLGIRQEGTEALVEASVTSVPTPLYEKTLAAGKELFAQCATFPEPKPYFCVHWPLRDELTKPETATFNMVPYDDGWRVAVQQ